MRIDILTIFPEYLEPLRHALIGKAIEEDRISIGVHNLRDWATGVHKSVDGPPAGGGAGMVMKPDVFGPALEDIAAGKRAGTSLTSATPHRHAPCGSQASVGAYGEAIVDTRPLLVVPTPAGARFDQAMAQELSREPHIVFACGRYEGIDQRVFDDAAQRYRIREVSIGDYVLIGGEAAVLVMCEALIRLVPGVLGNERSHLEDSFSDGLLEGPSYTAPRTWRGLEIPEVLLSGDHGKIEAYRRATALHRTKQFRPDLLEVADLTEDDRFELNAREVSVTVDARGFELGRPSKIRRKLRRRGFFVDKLEATGDSVVAVGRTLLTTDEAAAVVREALGEKT